jgi:hypothetical protein
MLQPIPSLGAAAADSPINDATRGETTGRHASTTPRLKARPLPLVVLIDALDPRRPLAVLLHFREAQNRNYRRDALMNTCIPISFDCEVGRVCESPPKGGRYAGVKVTVC